MASPQLEEGNFPIANELAEIWGRKRISGEEWQVLWVILRKTYGWRKKEDKISLSQFAAATDMPRQTVLRAINKLSAKNIISVIKNGYRRPNIYRFNKDFDTWNTLSKKGVIKNDNQVSSKMIHTIDSITKYKIHHSTTI
jgi:phage replication O-like protein O